ncbi:hypothetical protein [Nostoc sp.]
MTNSYQNVLVLSLRATTEAIAKEILDAWFSTPYSDDEWNLLQMQRIIAFPNHMRYILAPSRRAGRGLGVGFLYLTKARTAIDQYSSVKHFFLLSVHSASLRFLKKFTLTKS